MIRTPQLSALSRPYAVAELGLGGVEGGDAAAGIALGGRLATQDR